MFSSPSFLCRTNKSVENIFVRREVAKRFPSPGPGRYTNGIAVEKIGKTRLCIGYLYSPRDVKRFFLLLYELIVIHFVVSANIVRRLAPEAQSKSLHVPRPWSPRLFFRQRASESY